MIELQAAATAVTSLNAAFNLTKTFLDVQGAVKVQAKVIELQQQILSAQQSAMSAQQTQTALLERIRDLESEVSRLQEWDVVQERYQLRDVGAGAFVYSPRTEPTSTQPNHWLCVNCFENSKRRSILQTQGRDVIDDSYMLFGCPQCKSSIRVGWSDGPHRRGELLADGSRSDSP